MTPKELLPLLRSKTREVCQKLLPNGREHGGEWLIGGVSGDKGKSMRIRLEGEKSGVWVDHDTGEKGDIIELWKAATGLNFKETIKEIHEFLNIPTEEETERPTATWKTLQREMGTGTERDLTDLATLRKLPSLDGLRLAVEHSHLFFGPVFDGPEGGPYTSHHSWIVTDASRKGAQTRRMDGKPWHGGHKAKTIRGTSGRWPIGIADSALPEIAFTEGGPDFLAAYTAVAMLGLQDRIQPISIFGSAQVIHPESLPLFRNKRVWMFFHADENYAGLSGAIRWEKQLRAFNAHVIPFDFSAYPGVKDLNDFMSALATPEPAITEIDW